MSNCTWREDKQGNWQTDCGGYFDLFDDTPVENGMAFCCYCGGKLVGVEYTEPTMEPDIPEVAATISLCCDIARIGWHKPSVMHTGLCGELHGGEIGPTYYLIDSGLVMDVDGTMRRRI